MHSSGYVSKEVSPTRSVSNDRRQAISVSLNRNVQKGFQYSQLLPFSLRHSRFRGNVLFIPVPTEYHENPLLMGIQFPCTSLTGRRRFIRRSILASSICLQCTLRHSTMLLIMVVMYRRRRISSFVRRYHYDTTVVRQGPS